MRKIAPLLLALVLVSVVPPATASAQCGNAGQVPCYEWSWCAWTGWFGECWGGLVYRPGTYYGCNYPWLQNYGAICLPCGGDWEPLCLSLPVCQPWHNPVGLCVPCGAGTQPVCWAWPECRQGNIDLFGFCSYRGHSEEPWTGVEGLGAIAQPGAQLVKGIADIHSHQFANLGFGGAVFWGAPYHKGGIDAALPWCDYTSQFPIVYPLVGLPTPTLPGSDPLMWEAHGPKLLQWASHPAAPHVAEGLHDVGGTGPFDGWPKATTMTHQQMYYKWLERAYQGGLRLMVMFAISNEAMCKISKRRVAQPGEAFQAGQELGSPWTCDDMPTMKDQIAAAKELETAIDLMDDNVANGSGWYRIVFDPAQARQAIREGKLAVVLGLEPDTLLGCKPADENQTRCADQDALDDQLKEYWDLGVRAIYPIHHFDNAFGGAAIFMDLQRTTNALATGSHFTTRNCWEEGYRFNFDPLNPLFLLAEGLRLIPLDTNDHSAPADCNDRGLTPAGESLIKALMKQKFIIDVDHMSRKMLDSVLTMAEQHQPKAYPLVSSHTNVKEHIPEIYEFSLTEAQIERLRAIGGMITAATPSSECASTREYAEKYTRAVDLMDYRSKPYTYPAVAFSSDFNGWGTQIRPPFGLPAGCLAQTGPRLPYPFTEELFGGDFLPQQTGSRTFNFNTDGLAHVGLLPDFFANLRQILPVPAPQEPPLPDPLEPLYYSAETYIQMWEKIGASDRLPPPDVTLTVSGTRGGNGWYTDDVTVDWNVSASEGDPVDWEHTQCSQGTLTTDSQGTTFTCSAATRSGSRSTHRVSIKRDATPPTITFVSRAPMANAAGWNNSDVTMTWSCDDPGEGSGEVSQSVQLVATAEAGGQTLTGTCEDAAGNTSSHTQGGINIDKTPPAIFFRFADIQDDPDGTINEAEALKWHNHQVVLRVEAADRVSGVASVTPTSLSFSTEGIAVGGTATASDNAGNTRTETSFPVRIDLTAPLITFVSRLPGPNAAGWNKTDVTVTWSCDDPGELSGEVNQAVQQTATAEAEAQTLTGTCEDVAGNSSSNTQGGINIDKTPPVIATSVSPPPNAAGWHHTDFTVLFTASDELSGVPDPAETSVVFNVEGTDLGATRSFEDRAGNPTSASIAGLKLDKTPPVLTCTASPSELWPVNHRLIPVAVNLAFNDGLSGKALYSMVQAASSEPDSGLGDGDTAGDISGFAVGDTTLTGALRAERAGTEKVGRVYTLGYTGFDVAGNSASCQTQVVVPHDQGKK